MKRLLYICCALLLAGTIPASPALAQLAGGAFAVPIGGLVGGGGSTTGGAFGLTGAVIYPAGGSAQGGAFAIHGGLPATLASGVSVAYSGAAVDTIPPGNRPVKVAYVGGSGAATGKFYYRFGGQVAYDSLNMTAGTGDTLQLTIPGNLTNPRGLDYYFVVTRGTATAYVGSAVTPYRYVIQYSGAFQAGIPAALPKTSYRIVSVPVNITESPTVTNIFGDNLGAYDKTKWRLFRYDRVTNTNIEYPNAANVTSARAYWLIVAADNQVYGARGYTRRPNRTVGGDQYFEIPLDSGWNQLANPLPFNVKWADVIFDTVGDTAGHSSVILEDSAYWYNGSGYNTTATIPAWGGVFVKTKRPGMKALFRYLDAAASPVRNQTPQAQPQASASDWTVDLSLSSQGYTDAGNYIGVRSDASVGEDKYDFSEPPAAPEGAQLAFKIPNDNSGLKRSDFRPAFSDGATWDLVLPKAVGRKLTATGIDGIPATMTATLILDAGIVIKLKEGAEVDIPNDVQSARLVVGNQSYTAGNESSVLPHAYALDQNFPNPFNPDTRIRFALPAQTRLRLDVFNVLGQKVRTLADETFPAGTHDVVWDGRNDQGRTVGSGVYFYRLSSDSFTATHRMLLLK